MKTPKSSAASSKARSKRGQPAAPSVTTEGRATTTRATPGGATLGRATEGRTSPTMDDIARVLGVTKVTVSCALSGKGRVAEKTRLRVVEMAREMGFAPNPQAQQLSRGRDMETVALFAHRLDLNVITRKLTVVQALLSRHGYKAPLYVCSYNNDAQIDDESQIVLRNLRLQRPRAILAHSHGLAKKGYEELLRYRDEGGHVVCYDNRVAIDCDNVVFDREHNAYAALRHLLELGHRDIGLFLNSPGVDCERLAGCRRALEECGIPFSEDNILRDFGRYAESEEIGAHLAQHFLGLQRKPTAVYLVDDGVAAAFITGLVRSGLRVPGDVSVIGQDDMPVGNFVSPVPLTTISQPINAIVGAVVDLLLARLNGDQRPPQSVVVRGELVLRESTGKI